MNMDHQAVRPRCRKEKVRHFEHGRNVFESETKAILLGMSNVDIFALTFDALQKSLSSDVRRAGVGGGKPIDNAIERIVLAQLRQQVVYRKEDLSRTRTLLLERFTNDTKAKANAVSQIEGCHRLSLSTCRQYEHVLQRRLASQKSSSERRMKDLIFEVVGEYGKSNIRIMRRQEYLRRTGRTKLLLALWTQNWQKFSLRLKFDLCQAMLQDRLVDSAVFATCQNIIQCTHLSAEQDKEELEAVVRKITKKVGLISDKKIAVQAVVRISKNARDKTLLPSSFRSAGTTKEVLEIVQLLKTWARKSAPPSTAQTNPAAANAAGAAAGQRNSASRGRSAPGGARPRPLPASSAPVASPLLKELLSTDCLSWLHPASYLPAQWDAVYSQQYASECLGNPSPEQDHFASFVRKYHAQYSCSLWSDRAYICLEERSLSTRSDHGTNTRAVSPDSALLAILGNITDAGKEEKRLALENAITMQLLVTLQEIYVDHPYVNVTHAHDSLRAETAVEALKTLRDLLAAPLTVVGFSSKHRTGLAKGNSSKTTQIIYKYLPAVPDVMVVRASNGALLHFAPAMLAHLPETKAFSGGVLTVEQQRQASLRCPHPQLMSLAMPESYHLSTVFCPVLTPVIDQQNLLREAAASSAAPGMLTAPMTSALPQSKPGAKAPAAPEIARKGDKFNPVSTDTLPASPLMMMPLSTDCMQALLQRYLLPLSGATASAEDITAEGAAAAGGASSSVPLGALNVLPDHARCRVVSTLTAPSEDVRRLRCSYVLLPDDKAAEVAAAAADTGTPRRVSLTNAEPAKPVSTVASPCYYLVQVYEVIDTAVPSPRPAQAGSLSSEMDDGSDPLSTTFSLTQSGKSAATSGKSAFDTSKKYDAEDDILRSAVLEEYRSVLGCDVIINPPARTKDAKDVKDAKGQRVQAGEKKVPGLFSSLAPPGAGAASQVVEEDQDEGDADAGDSVSGGSAGGASGTASGAPSKRRWDINILSTVCRWRSCLCGSALVRVGKSNTFKQKQLCSYHLEMKDFLDGKGGAKQGVLESSKYLPRKAPNFNAAAIAEKKRDMMTIRAASTLLQELWDGKLRATVRSFTKKVVRDMTLRNFLEASNTSFLISHPSYMSYLTGNADASSRSANSPFSVKSYLSTRPAIETVSNSVVPSQPTWSIWKSKAYLERTVEGQNLSLSILDAILLTEKTIARELEMLADMRAYPSTELALIRKEVKAFKEQQEQILAKSGEAGKGAAAGVNHREASAIAAAAGGGGDGTLEDLTSQLNSGYDDLVAILSAENKLCERKLLMMACRRQEEEERRAQYVKKLARAKAAEDSQARDPANFGNRRF